MGNKESKSYPRYKYDANGEGDKRHHQSREEFDRRWKVFITSLDVGPERIRQIEGLEPKQKQELLQNFESNNPKCSAFHYVTLIKGLRSGRVGTSSKKKDDFQNAKEVLSATEISLRTNNVDWVYDFLNQQGLDVLIDYMSKTIYTLLKWCLVGHDCFTLRSGEISGAASLPRVRSAGLPDGPPGPGGSVSRATGAGMAPRSKSLGRATRPPPVNDAIKDSLHLGLKCFRAILNNQRGCSLAFEHSDAINVVTLCLLHPSYLTKTLVLEVLAAVCLIECGHERVVKAFDHFKAVTGEGQRFETLMYFFTQHETLSLDNYNIDYMVSCMQFINIVVHSVDHDINLRVYLQFEFKVLGLEEFIKKLQERPGDRLNSQADAYVDNLVDVSVLLDDSEQKEAFSHENERLERELAALQEQVETMEDEAAGKLAQLNQRLSVMQAELFDAKAREDHQKTQVAAFQRHLTDLDRSASDREKDLENQIEELKKEVRMSTASLQDSNTTIEELREEVDALRRSLANQRLNMDHVTSNSTNPFKTGLENMQSAPPPIPPHGGKSEGPNAVVETDLPIRPLIPTKHKLPLVNWASLRPQLVKGTVFATLDDRKCRDKIDFDRFEEIFRVDEGAGPLFDSPPLVNGDAAEVKVQSGKKSIMDMDRYKSLNSLLHFLEHERLTLDQLRRSVEAMALNSTVAQRVLPQCPTPLEAQRYLEYELERGSDVAQQELTDEDLLLLNLVKMDRLTPRLCIILYMAAFEDNWRALQAKVQVVSIASASVRKSQEFRDVLELVLAFGNHMNSSRRGITYGFRLQTLDLLNETKSADKKWTLLHYIALTIEEKFSSLLSFYDYITGLEEASKVPLESLTTDVSSLCHGMNQAISELNATGKDQAPPLLAEFVRTNEKRVDLLRQESEATRARFLEAADWFGERHSGVSPDQMFGVLVRFVDNFKKAVHDNTKRRRVDRLPSSSGPSYVTSTGDSGSHSGKKKERKVPKDSKNPNRRKKNRTRQINADGIMDEIMAGLGSEPLQAEVHRRKLRNDE